jgi:hypothetical protein
VAQHHSATRLSSKSKPLSNLLPSSTPASPSSTNPQNPLVSSAAAVTSRLPQAWAPACPSHLDAFPGVLQPAALACRAHALVHLREHALVGSMQPRTHPPLGCGLPCHATPCGHAMRTCRRGRGRGRVNGGCPVGPKQSKAQRHTGTC